MVRSSLLILLLVSPAFALAQGASPEFTVATWNLQQFVDQYDNPYYSRDTSPEFIKSPEMIDAIVADLRALNADVLALEEVEGTDFLRALLGERLPDLGYTHFASAPDDNWHQNVAVISRFPMGPMTSMGTVATPIVGTDESTDFINDRLLAVEIRPTPDYSFLLVAVHLKAGGGARNAGWRMGQIEFLRSWLDDQRKIDPDLNVCILGDFNSTPGSEEMNLWMDPAEGPIYRSLLTEVGAPPTHPSWAPEHEIDNILVNGAMWPEHIPNSAAVQRDIGPAEGHRCSDHLPVEARFVTVDQ
jgi:endonuclease/exonuclease/phosphatase family metal-dependent hydrolase